MVCTGNICRSPAAERLLASALESRDRVRVMSAGLGAMAGQPIDGPIAELLARRGVSTDAFASRPLTAHMVESADLILTMTRRQQSAVLLLVPSAGRRTFLLRELATILAELGAPSQPHAHQSIELAADRLRAALPIAVAARAERGAIRGLQNFDIEDPYRQPDRVVVASVARIDESISSLLDWLQIGAKRSVEQGE